MVFAYVSVACQQDPRLRQHDTSYIFQIHGTMYHVLGPLAGDILRNVGLNFLDPTEAMDIRQSSHRTLNKFSVLLHDIDALLRAESPFHRFFIRAHEVLDGHPGLPYLRLNSQLRLLPPGRDQDARRYNLPTVSSEIAAFMPDIPSEYGGTGYRDVLIYLRGRPCRQPRTGALSVVMGEDVLEVNEEDATVSPTSTQSICSTSLSIMWSSGRGVVVATSAIFNCKA